MSGGNFLSYRRDDSRHAAGRLADHLTKTFGRDQLFMDVDTIELGADFVDAVSTKVASCNALLAVIGPNWLQPRLDDPNDFVRIEVSAALQRDIPVIPVLVDGAQLPKAEELPEPLRPLVRRQGTRLSHERFGADAELLISSLAKIVPPTYRASVTDHTGRTTKAPEKGRRRPEIKPLNQPVVAASLEVIKQFLGLVGSMIFAIVIVAFVIFLGSIIFGK
jgi:TIR domain